MKAIKELWKTGEYTEDMMVQTLKCSYMSFRSSLIEYGLPLPSTVADGVHEEIYREYHTGADDRYESCQWISEAYGISTATAMRYRRDRPKSVQLTGFTDKDIERHLEAGFAPAVIANMLGCSSNRIRKLMKPQRATITADVRMSIEDDLAAGKPQKLIALTYGVSESSVSKLNPNKTPKPKRPPLSDEHWHDLKVSMVRYSVSELARMYNVSRAYIYGRLAKEKTS